MLVASVTVVAGAMLAVQRGTEDDPSAAPTQDRPDPLGEIHWTSASAGSPDRPLVTNLVPVAADPDGADPRAVVVASTGTVLWGMDGDDGEVLWERRLPREVASAPVPIDGAVLVAEPTATSESRLTAVDAATGVPRWERVVPDGTDVAAGDTVVLLRTGDELEALAADDGSDRWRRAVSGTVLDADGRHILLLLDGGGTLVALATADGSTLWEEELAPSAPAIRATATLADSQVAVVGEGDGTVRGLDRSTGETRWTSPTARRGETLAVTPGGLVVFVDRGRDYTALDARTGTLAWEAGGLVVSPEDLLIGSREAVSVTSDRQVTGIGLIDGSTLWQARLAPVGEVAVVGDRAVFSDGDGRILGVAVADRSATWETWLPHIGRDVLLASSDGALVRAATTRSNLTVYEPATGAVRWSERVGTGATTAPGAGAGKLVLRRALTRPAADYPAGLAITAMDETDGTVLWEVPGADVETPAWLPSIHPASVQWLATIPPTVSGDLVVEVAGEAVRAYAAERGELRWESTEPHAMATAPATTRELVIVGDVTGELVALERDDGDVRWVTSLDAPIAAAPTVSGDAVVAVTIDGGVHALDAATGEQRWGGLLRTPPRYRPVIVDDLVVVTGRDIVALELDDGAERWHHRTGAPVAGAPAPADGALHVTTTDGGVVALDLNDGRTVGHFLVPQPVAAGPLVIEGRTYVLTLRGEVHAVGPRDAESELWPLPPIDGRR